MALDFPAMEPPARPAAHSKRYRAWLLTVLLLSSALNLGDRTGIAVVGQAIKVDLRLSDAQMGIILGFAFAIFYSLLGLPFARLAERFSRTKLIAFAIGAFGLMVALCSRAHGFWELLLTRVGVSVGDAGLGPPVASLIGDHYSRERRGSAMSMVWIGGAFGVVFGPMLGGWLAQHVSWRAMFVAFGAPAMLLAIVALISLREPLRGALDPTGSTAGPPPSMRVVLKFLLGKPSVRHVLIGCALASVVMTGVGQFLAQFMVRQYRIGFAEVGRVLALPNGISWASGMLIGGFGIDLAARRLDRRWYVWGPAVTLVFSAPAFLLALSRETVIAAAGGFTIALMLLFVYWAPSLALAQNMAAASMRASSAFLMSLMVSLIGTGVGPTLVGFLSDRFASHAFGAGHFAQVCSGSPGTTGATAAVRSMCAGASATGMRQALMAVSLLALWAGVHYFLAARTLRDDLETYYAPRPEESPHPSPAGA